MSGSTEFNLLDSDSRRRSRALSKEGRGFLFDVLTGLGFESPVIEGGTEARGSIAFRLDGRTAELAIEDDPQARLLRKWDAFLWWRCARCGFEWRGKKFASAKAFRDLLESEGTQFHYSKLVCVACSTIPSAPPGTDDLVSFLERELAAPSVDWEAKARGLSDQKVAELVALLLNKRESLFPPPPPNGSSSDRAVLGINSGNQGSFEVTMFNLEDAVSRACHIVLHSHDVVIPLSFAGSPLVKLRMMGLAVGQDSQAEGLAIFVGQVNRVADLVRAKVLRLVPILGDDVESHARLYENALDDSAVNAVNKAWLRMDDLGSAHLSEVVDGGPIGSNYPRARRKYELMKYVPADLTMAAMFGGSLALQNPVAAAATQDLLTGVHRRQKSALTSEVVSKLPILKSKRLPVAELVALRKSSKAFDEWRRTYSIYVKELSTIASASPDLNKRSQKLADGLFAPRLAELKEEIQKNTPIRRFFQGAVVPTVYAVFHAVLLGDPIPLGLAAAEGATEVAHGARKQAGRRALVSHFELFTSPRLAK